MKRLIAEEGGTVDAAKNIFVSLTVRPNRNSTAVVLIAKINTMRLLYRGL